MQNNVHLLHEMLTHYSPGKDPRLEENEIIQDMFKACSEMQPKLHKLIAGMDEKAEGLGLLK